MNDSQKYDLDTVQGRLLYLLDKRGKQEKDVVEATGLSQSTVNAALSGARKNPSVKTLAPIADYLEANLLWIAEGTGEPFTSGPKASPDARQEADLLLGIKHGLILAGVDPNSAEFHRKVTAAFDNAKADARGTGAA